MDKTLEELKEELHNSIDNIKTDKYAREILARVNYMSSLENDLVDYVVNEVIRNFLCYIGDRNISNGYNKENIVFRNKFVKNVVKLGKEFSEDISRGLGFQFGITFDSDEIFESFYKKLVTDNGLSKHKHVSHEQLESIYLKYRANLQYKLEEEI